MTTEVAYELREQIRRQREWEAMTREQKQQQLLLRQKELLKTFFDRHAITRAQYEEGMTALCFTRGEQPRKQKQLN